MIHVMLLLGCNCQLYNSSHLLVTADVSVSKGPLSSAVIFILGDCSLVNFLSVLRAMLLLPTENQELLISLCSFIQFSLARFILLLLFLFTLLYNRATSGSAFLIFFNFRLVLLKPKMSFITLGLLIFLNLPSVSADAAETRLSVSLS